MELGIDGKNALVTGGSLGIGRAIAAELTANRANVAIVARNAERLEAAARELSGNSGGRVIGIPGDMASAEDITRVIGATREALGGIDILVNNAGSSPAGRLQDLDDATWEAAFGLKLMGYMRCAREVVPEMRSRKWGRIVNIIGAGGHSPSPRYILGGTFNAALFNFTRALAMDCAPDNVLVTGINPGATDTPRWQTLIEQQSRISDSTPEEFNEATIANIPLGKLGNPEDIANLVAFLCSDRAGHIAGALIDVDGATRKGL